MTTEACFYHYTCEHGHAELGAGGVLRTASEQLGMAAAAVRFRSLIGPRWVWCTDMAHPIPDALGLTSIVTPCDRTAHRYRVVNVGALMAWRSVARALYSREQRDPLELSPGAQPKHWFVGHGNTVKVEYDPL